MINIMNLKKILIFIKKIFYYPNFSYLNVDYKKYWKLRRGDDSLTLNSFQKFRAELIINYLKENSSILDIGSGDGALLNFFAKNKKLKITASDIFIEKLDHLTKYGVNLMKLNINNIDNIKNLEKYDYILILEVLEHIQNSEEILLNLLKKTDKSIFFSIPNTGYLSHRLRLLFGRFPLQWNGNPSEHIRFWTYKDLIWWLNSLGLLKKSNIYIYEGIPILNKVKPSLFGAGFLVKIDK